MRAVPIGTAQDHKRIFDDDRGPNTGGMGAFAPSPLVDAALEARIMREIVDPVMSGMAGEGHPFRGFLFVGKFLEGFWSRRFAVDDVPDLLLGKKHLALERPRVIIMVLQLFDAVSASIAFGRGSVSHYE